MSSLGPFIYTGDKLAPRCAQMGTIGMIVNRSQMPYYEFMAEPIINPDCFIKIKSINEKNNHDEFDELPDLEDM